ncbi:MAG: hypothetical protein H6R21_1530, partial [Proteobacteria bacterium]|nr:hypothetical protein [Pseudomonadota bacterium]
MSKIWSQLALRLAAAAVVGLLLWPVSGAPA